MQPNNPSLVCEVCGARVTTLRRGRCWVCYVRWSESRPVGGGAACMICGDRRRENLRLVEFQCRWVPMCHNCGTKTMRLSPTPTSINGLRESLTRNRRQLERRSDNADERLIKMERRVGERRLPPNDVACEWLDAEDLVVEVIELREGEESSAELTRIAAQMVETQPSAES